MAGEASVLIGTFRERYGGAASPRVFRAPGRVNLIGEHTDYNLGFVMPVALDLACFTATAPNRDGKLRVFSANMEQEREWPVEELAGSQPARDWSDYVRGVARELIRAGFGVQPCNLGILSTVPVGSGLSSSAAIEVSVALALLGDRKMAPLELVKLCRRAENEFVGMPCGIMDQYISVFGREKAAIKIDCRSLENEVVPLPADVEFLAVNSMVKHELGSSAYRQRVEEGKIAVAAIQRRRPEVGSLRDVISAELIAYEDAIPPVVMRRARHVASENERVEAFIQASHRGDKDAMGALLIASHRSLQKDYEVSCEELDFLVDTALSIPGVYGARMTGGGFGGCTVSMMRSEAVPEFRCAIREHYRSRFNIDPQIIPCRPSSGAGEVAL